MTEFQETQETATRSVDDPMRNSQWTLASLFWLTTTIALVLAYASRLGIQAYRQAVLYALMVLLCGLILGSIGRQWKNAWYWAGLYALLAYLAVAGGNLPHISIAYGWGLVGSVVGSVLAVVRSRHWAWVTLLCSLLGWSAMVAVVVVMGQPLSGLIAFDTLVAGLVGAILNPFTALLEWFERESRQPRIVIASWLALSVLIGNSLVPILAGIQR